MADDTVTTRPDPTERVLQAVAEAVRASRELLEAKIDKNYEIFHERFDTLKQANNWARDTSNERVKMLLDKMEADRRSDRDNTMTAFAAANAASDKQEKSFIKLLDTLGSTVSDLKDRIVVIEGKASVADPSTAHTLRDLTNAAATLRASADQAAGRREQSSVSSTMLVGVIAAFAALALVVVDLAGLFKHG